MTSINKILILIFQDDVTVLDSLTGQPFEEDEILFCLAVCAPYSVLQNYK